MFGPQYWSENLFRLGTEYVGEEAIEMIRH